MNQAPCYDLGPLSQIPVGEGRVFRIDDLEVAVFRTREGRVYATQASCPHRGGPLADGLVGDGTVICPLHAFRFDLATGSPLDSSCMPLAMYPVVVVGGGRLMLELDARNTRETAGSP